MTREYESELSASREEIATVLRGMADGVAAGSVRLGEGDDALTVELPEELTVEVELESEDDAVELELELEWPRAEGTVEESTAPADEDRESTAPVAESPESTTDGAVDDDVDDVPVPIGAADPLEKLARFELFRDRGDEWRWRLVHRNGNIIATSGEGYTQKHNARKGLRSVVENAPEATVTDEPGE